MTYVLRFLSEVEEDVISGYEWYESKSPGLGEEFLQMVYNYSREILCNPQLYLKVHSKFRRRILKKFPYAIYYMIEDDRIIVFGLFHCARDPRAIRRKLRDREEPVRYKS
jgi:toxin ParE1/3/4